MDAPTVIYVAAYGYQHNDALGRVWGRTPVYCKRALRSAIAGIVRADCWRDRYGPTPQSLRDQIWETEPFAESVEDVIKDLEDSSREAEFRDDLVSRAGCGGVY